MSELSLTPKQLNVLRFIQDYQDSHGFAPTLDEIAAEFSVNKVTIHGHLVELERKGAVRREPRMARSIRVVQSPPIPRKPRTQLSIAGTIAAGQPLEALETPESFDLTQLIPENCESYLLKVEGDSMIEDQIRSGDLVLIERRNHARNGEIVVAITPDNEATLKRLYKEKRGYRLQPANASMKPIYVKELEIRGVVTAVIRRLER